MKKVILFAGLCIGLFLVSFKSGTEKLVLLPGKGIILNGDSILLSKIEFLHTRFKVKTDTIIIISCGEKSSYSDCLINISYENIECSYYLLDCNLDSIINREIKIEPNLSNSIISINNKYNLNRMNTDFENCFYLTPYRKKEERKFIFSRYDYPSLGIFFSIDSLNYNRFNDLIRITEPQK